MNRKMERYSAIVLKRTNYGEADRIVNFLTPSGKRSAMARGVRKEKSKLAGAIEPLVVSDIVLVDGKGDLSTLTSARIDVYYSHIVKDYERLQFAYEAMRLISKASEMIDEPIWFSVLNEVLAGLDDFTIDLNLIEAWFYLRFSSLEGHELNLNLDVDGKPLERDKKYQYDREEQGLSSDERGGLTSDHIKLMRLIATKPIRICAQIGGVEDVLGDCMYLAKEHAAVS